MKLTIKDLNVIFSMAKQELMDSPSRGLDDHENLARCWLIAVSRFLNVNHTYVFPMQQIIEPDDE